MLFRATSLVYNTKEKNRASWGFSYLSDKVYVENQGMASVDYGYKLQLNTNTNLHLGIKVGANFNNIDIDKLNSTISIAPSFLYRIVSDAPNQITVIRKINFKDQLQVGMCVSNNDYISAMLVFSGMQKLDFGYGYEMGQRTSSTALRANTHELFMRFKFGKQAKSNVKLSNTF